MDVPFPPTAAVSSALQVRWIESFWPDRGAGNRSNERASPPGATPKVREFLQEAQAGFHGVAKFCMTVNSSDSLPFESPDEENIRLREEKARLRRILTVHGIPAPAFMPESSLTAKAAETATAESK